MKIEHLAIWVKDIEMMRRFYMTYFNMGSNEKYENTSKQFSSYFLSFEGAETSIELMHNPNILKAMTDSGVEMGLTHFAISVGSKNNVDALTARLRTDGYSIVGEPRTTGDGYYESVVLDCEGNRIEITA